MIKAINKVYNEYTTNVTWGNFSVSSHGKKRIGVAPFITFNIDDKIFIGLEFIFSDKMFQDCKIDTRINITEYLSDICYEDEKGWISITTGEYWLYITRVNSNSFKFEFYVEDGEIKIIIDSIVVLLK